MSDKLPYRAEYAKSGRSRCRSCNSEIEEDSLRLAVMHPMLGYKLPWVPYWYHFDCFWDENLPKSVGQIANFNSLRRKDQEKIELMIDAMMDLDDSDD